MLNYFRHRRRSRHQLRIVELTEEVTRLQSELRIKDAEIENLSLCLARDRERIKAELQSYAVATAEGGKK